MIRVKIIRNLDNYANYKNQDLPKYKFNNNLKISEIAKTVSKIKLVYKAICKQKMIFPFPNKVIKWISL